VLGCVDRVAVSPSYPSARVVNVEESPREAPPADAWRETFAQTIEQQRRRVGERIAGQRERLRDLDARIASQLDEATQELAREQDQTRQAAAKAEARDSVLQDRQAQLEKRQRQLDEKQAELDKQQADQIRAQAAAPGAGQDPELQLRISELQGKCQQLRDELDSRAAQRDEATERLADLKAQLELRQQRQTELEAERKGLQADVQKHREECRSQAEAAKADLVRHASELDRVRRESQGQIEQLRADYAKSRDSQVQALQQQLDELRAKLADSEAAAGRFQRELEQQLDAARKSSREGLPAGPELAALRDENKQLETWLAEAEAKAKTTGSGGGQEMDDLRRRFEMAVQDVRELKTKNVELTEQLAKARQPSGGASAAGVSSGGWESLKKKLLADLETDFDDEDGAEKADKLTVHGAIKITDQVVAEKEREIEELRSLLQSQTQQVGDVAVGAAAVAQMLDTDELIRQEREALKRLQDSLREQLRQAEVDISVERAKLARERAEVDEKIRGIEAEKANMPAVGSEHVGEKGKKPGGRKWLTRLGLGDGKEE